MRRIRARLRDLESTVRQQQGLLAAYGGTEADDADVAHVAALSALDRAEGALRFLPEQGDYAAVAAEFRSVVEAVAPALRNK